MASDALRQQLGPGSRGQFVRAAYICATKGCQKAGDLQRCGGCKVVAYCSVECQKKDWESHKGDCKKGRTRTKQGGIGTELKPRDGVKPEVEVEVSEDKPATQVEH